MLPFSLTITTAAPQRATDSNETAIGGTIAYSQLSSLRGTHLIPLAA